MGMCKFSEESNGFYRGDLGRKYPVKVRGERIIPEFLNSLFRQMKNGFVLLSLPTVVLGPCPG
jgi:hypothetical protein